MAMTTKASRIRSIIQQIGADRQNPPADWRQRVEATLKKEGIKAHIVTIYQQRSLLMNKGNKSKRTAPSHEGLTVSVQQVLAIKAVVKQLGDIKSVRKALEVFEALTND